MSGVRNELIRLMTVTTATSGEANLTSISLAVSVTPFRKVERTPRTSRSTSWRLRVQPPDGLMWF